MEQKRIGTVEPIYKDGDLHIRNYKLAYVYGAIKKYGNDVAYLDSLEDYIHRVLKPSMTVDRADERRKAAEVFTKGKTNDAELFRWLDGAEWADHTMVERACEFLEMYYERMRAEALTCEELVSRFREIMLNKL